MKTCRICGKAMDDNYTVCPYCGMALDAEAEQNVRNDVPPYGQPNQQYSQQYGQQYNQQNNMGYNPVPNQPPEYTPAPRPQRSAYVAAFLSFALGMFGAHNFYLDRKKKALIMLLVTLIGMGLTFGVSAIAMEVWAIIDGIKILKGEINTDGNGSLIKMGF